MENNWWFLEWYDEENSEFDVNFPIVILEKLKQVWVLLPEYQIKEIQNSVKYDIAKKLSYSEDWIYSLYSFQDNYLVVAFSQILQFKLNLCELSLPNFEHLIEYLIKLKSVFEGFNVQI